MDDTVITTTGLTRRYGEQLAVDSVDLTVRRGEVYGFLGPNGAGKTTTLRMILGLVRPTAGSARVLGRPAGTPEAMARVGALIEGPGFYPFLSGRDNLLVLAKYRGVPEADVDPALGCVDLAGRAGNRYRTYSLGMKQRLGVAAALLGRPDVVVLDEPTNGLDPAGMADMRALLAGLARSGQTVLLSSHLLGEVEQVCDRIGVIVGGRLLRESSVAELRGEVGIRLTAMPGDVARAVAEEVAGRDAVTAEGNGLRVAVPADRAPDLVRALVTHDVDVHGVSAQERTLESVFFELTSDGPAAPDRTGASR